MEGETVVTLKCKESCSHRFFREVEERMETLSWSIGPYEINKQKIHKRILSIFHSVSKITSIIQEKKSKLNSLCSNKQNLTVHSEQSF